MGLDCLLPLFPFLPVLAFTVTCKEKLQQAVDFISLRFLKQFLLFFPLAKVLVMVGFGPDMSLGGGGDRGYGEADVAVAAVFVG